MTKQSPSALPFRVGLGTDLHRIVSGRPLMLAGVEIESPFGLDGHSDADVVLHAVIDALLGAAGLPDIGELFPNSDPSYQGADSRDLMRTALDRVRDAGFAPINVDLVIHAERPAIGPEKSRMRASLSALLGVHESCVNLKGKSGEGIGIIGKGEGISCTAVALLGRIGE
ncbi:MAG: 2-C-methyl-D-erythritol 2,4-cyclodiphosphate synthase [Phycisphaerae bacterium]